MIRVLHCLGGLGTGGTETLIMNWYRHIDRSVVQFDFLVRDQQDYYVNEINELGGVVYWTSPFPRHALRNYIDTAKLLSQDKWDVIHVHGNAALYILPLLIAKKFKIPHRVMHSHSNKSQNKLYTFIHYVNRSLISSFVTDRLACSVEAGKWMYGKKPFIVIKNAVDYDQFRFDDNDRKTIRKQFGIEDSFVIGHVGRFSLPKNHTFILDVFHKIHNKKQDAVLVLVGEGELKRSIIKKAEKLGLSKYVIFVGHTSNVGSYLSAMDAFIFPSHWEGLGNALIEAQINGLPCFVNSSLLKEEVILSNLLIPLKIRNNSITWAKRMLEFNYNCLSRGMRYEEFEKCGYDIHAVVNDLEQIYEKEVM